MNKILYILLFLTSFISNAQDTLAGLYMLEGQTTYPPRAQPLNFDFIWLNNNDSTSITENLITQFSYSKPDSFIYLEPTNREIMWRGKVIGNRLSLELINNISGNKINSSTWIKITPSPQKEEDSKRFFTPGHSYHFDFNDQYLNGFTIDIGKDTVITYDYENNKVSNSCTIQVHELVNQTFLKITESHELTNWLVFLKTNTENQMIVSLPQLPDIKVYKLKFPEEDKVQQLKKRLSGNWDARNLKTDSNHFAFMGIDSVLNMEINFHLKKNGSYKYASSGIIYHEGESQVSSYDEKGKWRISESGNHIILNKKNTEPLFISLENFTDDEIKISKYSYLTLQDIRIILTRKQ